LPVGVQKFWPAMATRAKGVPPKMRAARMKVATRDRQVRLSSGPGAHVIMWRRDHLQVSMPSPWGISAKKSYP